MFSFSTLRNACLAACLAVFGGSLCAAEFSEHQVTLVESLDAAAAEQAAPLAAKATAWTKELAALEGDPKAAKAWEIGNELAAVMEKTPSLAALTSYAQAAPVIQTGRTQWRTARFSSTEYAGFTSQNFREEARRRAEKAAGDQLAALFTATIFPALEELAEPAAYVNRFTAGRYREWTERALTLPDKTLTFRVVPAAAGTPLLAPQTRLEIDVEYLPGDLTIRAQGLRFRYAADEPQAVVDEVNVAGELPETVLKVKKLGAALVGTRDAPIQITLVGKPDFAQVVDGRRGALTFDVAARLFPGSPLAAEGKGLTLFPGNHVAWGKNPLVAKAADDAPVRIGRSPFALWSVDGTLDPTTAQFRSKAIVGAFEKLPESVALDAEVEGKSPLTELAYSGPVIAQGKRWLFAAGKIDPAADRIDGTFGSANCEEVAGLKADKGTISLERGRLLVDGSFEVFGLGFPKLHCEVDLVDGAGRFYSDDGTTIAATFDGRIAEGFKSVRLSAVQSVRVAGSKELGDLWTTPVLTADTSRKPPVEWTIYTFDSKGPAKVSGDKISDVTVERISTAVTEQAAAAHDVRQKALAAAALAPLPNDAAAKPRVERLEQLARAIEKLTLDLVVQSEDRRQAGRRSSLRSEMHVKFLTPVTMGANREKSGDAVLTFAWQASGFTCEILPPSAEPVVRAAADLKTGRIVIADFIGDRPRVQIDLPEFEHGSAVDAVQRTRDELQTLVETYFPEARIEGPQRRVEKQLVIRNDAAEPISVWVVPHARRAQDGKLQSAWQAKPLRFEVAAQSSLPLTVDQDQPLAADRVRLWAESASGQRWNAHRYEELPLVDLDPLYNGRLYHAEQLATYEHAITPPTEPQLFTERVVEFRNDSTELLHVKLAYQTTDVGISSEQSVEFDLKPDETLRPRDAEGRQIRASRIKFSADAENRRFNHGATEPVWLVDETAGRRAYTAPSIGTYRHVFLPHEGAPSVAVITAAKVDVMSGRAVVAGVRRGEKYKVLDRNEGWVLVGVKVGGEEKTGWLEKQHVVIENAGPPAPPQPVEKTLRITAATVNVQIGTDVIGQVVKDQTFRILQRRAGWSRVEFEVDGEPRQGWIDERKGTVQ